MTIAVSHFFIQVHDTDLALAFYRDVLGLEQRNDVVRDQFRWITVASPSQDLEIVITNWLQGSPEDAAAMLALLTKGALNPVVFRTDDLDTMFEKISASGADVVQEPTDQPWGARDCAVRDPSGNMVRIAQA